MNLLTQAAVIKHLTKMFDRSTPTAQTVDFTMNKPLCPYMNEEVLPLPRATPESVGIKSGYIREFLNEMSSHKELDIHGIMIMKDGKIICDAEFGPYDPRFWHAGYSLSKSVTATAIGLLIDEGKISLSDKVVKLLDGIIPQIAHLTHKSITVRDLLTMTSGVGFTEPGSVVEKSWIKSYFETIPKADVGSTFSYNSLNSYVLSYIVKVVSGYGLTEYLMPRLFEPLGITVYNWEKSPEGVEAGGWGLYLRREDVAKLAKLYIDGGMWNGKRIISEKWVSDATTAKIETPFSCGNFNYGYHIWVGRNNNSFLFNGMFGQDMIAYPKSKTAIILNAGIEQLFQQSCYYSIVEKYFGSDYFSDNPIKENKKEQKKLALYLNTLKGEKKKKIFEKAPKIPQFITRNAGVKYSCRASDISGSVKTECITGTANLGVLPLVEQTIRNRYTKGINSFEIVKNRDKTFALRIEEADQKILLPIAADGYVRTKLVLSETEYHAAVSSLFSSDEDGRNVLKLRISFPEISSSRIIKIFFDDGFIDVEMNEIPGLKLAKYAISSVDESIKGKKLVSDIVSKIEPDMLYYKLQNTIEPKFRLYSEV